MNTDLNKEALLELDDVLSILKVGKTTLYKFVIDGALPSPIKIGRRSLWRKSDLNQAITNLSIQSTFKQTMNKITRPQYLQAQYSAARLNPLKTALANIDDQSLNHNQEAINKFNEFRDFITPIITKAVEAVEAAQQQYNNRDQDLLSAASTRLHRIDDDIHLTTINKNDLSKTYQNKIEELKKQRFSLEEISKIVVDPTNEVAALDVKIEALKAEKVKIQSFLNDAPTYDETLLEGTNVFEIKELQQAIKTMVVNR